MAGKILADEPCPGRIAAAGPGLGDQLDLAPLVEGLDARIGLRARRHARRRQQRQGTNKRGANVSHHWRIEPLPEIPAEWTAWSRKKFTPPRPPHQVEPTSRAPRSGPR